MRLFWCVSIVLALAGVPGGGLVAGGQDPSSPSERIASELVNAPPDARVRLLAAIPTFSRADIVTALLALSERSRRMAEFTQGFDASQLALALANETGDAKSKARALTAQAAIHVARGESAEAVRVLAESRDFRQGLGDREILADALDVMSGAHFYTGNNAAAVSTAREALAIRRELGEPGGIARSLNAAGMAERQRSELDRAVSFYEEAIPQATAAGDDFVLARLLNNIAVAERERGYNDRAIGYYRSGLEINERIGARASAANTLSNLGMSYQDQGLNDVALEHFLKALAVQEAIGDRRNVASTLGNIGFLYRQQGNDVLALEYYRRSLAVAEALGYRDGMARMIDFIARVHTSRGEYEDAAEHFTRALEIRHIMGDRAGIANLTFAYGFTFERQGNFDRALELYRDGAALFDEIGERRSLTFSNLRLAALYNKRGEYREALAAAKRGAAAIETTGHQARDWALQLAIGRAERGLGNLPASRQAFDRAIASIERLRDQVAGGEEERQRAFEQQIDPYHEMVTLLADAGDTRSALAYAERAKGRVLLDVLRNGRVNVTKAMSDSEKDEERRRNAALVTAAAVLQREQQRRSPDAARIAELERAVESARTEAETFRSALYVRHPELRVRRSEIPPVTLDELGALVPDAQTALLEYVVTRTATYAFVVTRDVSLELSVHRIDRTPERLERDIDDFRAALGRRDLGFRTQAKDLHAALVEPVMTRVGTRSRLVIVPEGPLWDLPFQALVGVDNRFIVERHTVSMAPSLTALREERRAAERQSSRAVSVVAFGDPDLGNPQPRVTGGLRDTEAAPLPASAAEVNALKRLYGSRSRVFVGRDATEGRFKGREAPSAIIHVSTHGILNNSDPMSSHLLLAPSTDGAAKEDGRLQAREILSLDLASDLAVLSGCDTARGRVGAGEGVIGLTWAFFVAGVPTTVVSQWKVESESTAQLMTGLHRRLAAPSAVTPAHALRSSALAMLATDRYRHPFYWAGFTVVGDGLRAWR